MPKELYSGFQLVDNFSDHFYFYSVTVVATTRPMSNSSTTSKSLR